MYILYNDMVIKYNTVILLYTPIWCYSRNNNTERMKDRNTM